MFNKSIIILAAGQGTRMKSDLSKVLHKLGNSLFKNIFNSSLRVSTLSIV